MNRKCSGMKIQMSFKHEKTLNFLHCKKNNSNYSDMNFHLLDWQNFKSLIKPIGKDMGETGNLNSSNKRTNWTLAGVAWLVGASSHLKMEGHRSRHMLRFQVPFLVGAHTRQPISVSLPPIPHPLSKINRHVLRRV